jgi:peptide/nickel transport system permease protein
MTNQRYKTGADGKSVTAPGLLRSVLAGLLRQPSVVVSLLFLLTMGALGVLAPFIGAFDPASQNLTNTLSGPSWAHPLGTDEYGRDLLSRVVYGARTALWASVQGITLAFVLGVPIGALAGYLGGRVDRLIGWIVDLFMSLPGMLVAFVVIAVLGTGLSNAMIGVGIVLATPYARLTRSVVLAERSALYVDAARVTGLGRFAILWRHVFPNVAPAIIVQTSILIGAVILIEASLSFLGLGAPVNVPSWGRILSQARFFVLEQPFYPWPPGLAIAMTVLAFNVVGDGLRDTLGSLGRTPSPRAGRRHRGSRAHVDRPSSTTCTSLPAAPSDTPPDTETSGRADDPIVEVRDLEVSFRDEAANGWLPVVDGVTLVVARGETLGLVGESGSGKSMTAQAVLGLLPDAARASGSARVAGKQIVGATRKELRGVRGRDVAMIFQDPARALNPAMRVVDQIGAPARRHLGMSRAAAREHAIELLRLLGINDPRSRARQYPHEMSGGMAQRIVIARALASRPSILLADEPTTALDVSVQAQILDLLREVREEFEMSMLFITHDLGIAADICDRVAVMYAGQLVEVDTVERVINEPLHPYTKLLLAALPESAPEDVEGAWSGIEGAMPAPGDISVGCRFAARCPLAVSQCVKADVPLAAAAGTSGAVRCVRADDAETRAWEPGVQVEFGVENGHE